MPSVRRAAPGFRRTTNHKRRSKPASPRLPIPATPAPIASSPAAASASQHPAAKSRPESNAGSNAAEPIPSAQPEDSAPAVSDNTQINARAKSIRRARSHRAQAARSARNEPDFARRANDLRRQTGRHRANRAERDSQPRSNIFQLSHAELAAANRGLVVANRTEWLHHHPFHKADGRFDKFPAIEQKNQVDLANDMTPPSLRSKRPI
jgi:hypothetical protein